MSNEVKKYNWFYSDSIQYTLEEYINKLDKLICIPVKQMRECDGDLFMSEFQKLIEGAYALDHLKNQLEGGKGLLVWEEEE
jgi:hypothetical protein